MENVLYQQTIGNLYLQYGFVRPIEHELFTINEQVEYDVLPSLSDAQQAELQEAQIVFHGYMKRIEAEKRGKDELKQDMGTKQPKTLSTRVGRPDQIPPSMNTAKEYFADHYAIPFKKTLFGDVLRFFDYRIDDPITDDMRTSLVANFKIPAENLINKTVLDAAELVATKNPNVMFGTLHRQKIINHIYFHNKKIEDDPIFNEFIHQFVGEFYEISLRNTKTRVDVYLNIINGFKSRILESKDDKKKITIGQHAIKQANDVYLAFTKEEDHVKKMYIFTQNYVFPDIWTVLNTPRIVQILLNHIHVIGTLGIHKNHRAIPEIFAMYLTDDCLVQLQHLASSSIHKEQHEIINLTPLGKNVDFVNTIQNISKRIDTIVFDSLRNRYFFKYSLRSLANDIMKCFYQVFKDWFISPVEDRKLIEMYLDTHIFKPIITPIIDIINTNETRLFSISNKVAFKTIRNNESITLELTNKLEELFDIINDSIYYKHQDIIDGHTFYLWLLHRLEPFVTIIQENIDRRVQEVKDKFHASSENVAMLAVYEEFQTSLQQFKEERKQAEITYNQLQHILQQREEYLNNHPDVSTIRNVMDQYRIIDELGNRSSKTQKYTLQFSRRKDDWKTTRLTTILEQQLHRLQQNTSANELKKKLDATTPRTTIAEFNEMIGKAKQNLLKQSTPELDNLDAQEEKLRDDLLYFQNNNYDLLKKYQPDKNADQIGAEDDDEKDNRRRSADSSDDEEENGGDATFNVADQLEKLKLPKFKNEGIILAYHSALSDLTIIGDKYQTQINRIKEAVKLNYAPIREGETYKQKRDRLTREAKRLNITNKVEINKYIADRIKLERNNVRYQTAFDEQHGSIISFNGINVFIDNKRVVQKHRTTRESNILEPSLMFLKRVRSMMKDENNRLQEAIQAIHGILIEIYPQRYMTNIIENNTTVSFKSNKFMIKFGIEHFNHMRQDSDEYKLIEYILNADNINFFIDITQHPSPIYVQTNGLVGTQKQLRFNRTVLLLDNIPSPDDLLQKIINEFVAAKTHLKIFDDMKSEEITLKFINEMLLDNYELQVEKIKLSYEADFDDEIEDFAAEMRMRNEMDRAMRQAARDMFVPRLLDIYIPSSTNPVIESMRYRLEEMLSTESITDVTMFNYAFGFLKQVTRNNVKLHYNDVIENMAKHLCPLLITLIKLEEGKSGEIQGYPDYAFVLRAKHQANPTTWTFTMMDYIFTSRENAIEYEGMMCKFAGILYKKHLTIPMSFAIDTNDIPTLFDTLVTVHREAMKTKLTTRTIHNKADYAIDFEDIKNKFVVTLDSKLLDNPNAMQEISNKYDQVIAQLRPTMTPTIYMFDMIVWELSSLIEEMKEDLKIVQSYRTPKAETTTDDDIIAKLDNAYAQFSKNDRSVFYTLHDKLLMIYSRMDSNIKTRDALKEILTSGLDTHKIVSILGLDKYKMITQHDWEIWLQNNARLWEYSIVPLINTLVKVATNETLTTVYKHLKTRIIPLIKHKHNTIDIHLKTSHAADGKIEYYPTNKIITNNIGFHNLTVEGKKTSSDGIWRAMSPITYPGQASPSCPYCDAYSGPYNNVIYHMMSEHMPVEIIHQYKMAPTITSQSLYEKYNIYELTNYNNLKLNKHKYTKKLDDSMIQAAMKTLLGKIFEIYDFSMPPTISKFKRRCPLPDFDFVENLLLLGPFVQNSKKLTLKPYPGYILIEECDVIFAKIMTFMMCQKFNLDERISRDLVMMNRYDLLNNESNVKQPMPSWAEAVHAATHNMKTYAFDVQTWLDYVSDSTNENIRISTIERDIQTYLQKQELYDQGVIPNFDDLCDEILSDWTLPTQSEFNHECDQLATKLQTEHASKNDIYTTLVELDHNKSSTMYFKNLIRAWRHILSDTDIQKDINVNIDTITSIAKKNISKLSTYIHTASNDAEFIDFMKDSLSNNNEFVYEMGANISTTREVLREIDTLARLSRGLATHDPNMMFTSYENVKMEREIKPRKDNYERRLESKQYADAVMKRMEQTMGDAADGGEAKVTKGDAVDGSVNAIYAADGIDEDDEDYMVANVRQLFTRYHSIMHELYD